MTRTPLGEAIATANIADEVFEHAIRQAGYASRWAWNMHLDPGPESVRAAYRAKVSADNAMHLAFIAARNGLPANNYSRLLWKRNTTMTTRKELRETEAMLNRLQALGIARQDAERLRLISMTLHRWHELECGLENGGVEQDESTGEWWWYNSRLGKRTHTVPDREKGARKRLAAIMARYPALKAYVQTDPRGASLYVLKPGDVPEGKDADAYYSRGVAVYR